MILKGEHPDGEEELIAPPIIVARIEVEDDPNKFLDVLYNDCLGMKIGDGGSFMQEQGLMKIVVVGGAILRIRRGFVVIIGAGRVVVIVARRASSGAIWFTTGQGVASARRSGIALQSGVLGLLLGSGGAC